MFLNLSARGLPILNPPTSLLSYQGQIFLWDICWAKNLFFSQILLLLQLGPKSIWPSSARRWGSLFNENLAITAFLFSPLLNLKLIAMALSFFLYNAWIVTHNNQLIPQSQYLFLPLVSFKCKVAIRKPR